MKKNKLKSFAFGVLTAFSSLSMAVEIENPGFETGNLEGWTVNGTEGLVEGNEFAYATTSFNYDDLNTSGCSGAPSDYFTEPYKAQHGNNFAVAITGNGTAEFPFTTKLSQTFYATKGDVIVGSSFFASVEPYVDYVQDSGQVVIITMEGVSLIEELASFTIGIPELDDLRNTPWIPWRFEAPANGDYSINISATNLSDGCFNSVVGIDLAETGGFVSGGGWINSPNEPTGKANFGFISKYKKDAVKPTGNVQFRFGDYKFHSNEYAFLEVTGDATSAQFSGVGTVNGAGNYGFTIWALDNSNDPDTFRIKIWDIDSGDEIYDNGADQPLGGGNILIKPQ